MSTTLPQPPMPSTSPPMPPMPPAPKTEKRAWYRRGWVIALVAFFIGGMIGTAGGDGQTPTADSGNDGRADALAADLDEANDRIVELEEELAHAMEEAEDGAATAAPDAQPEPVEPEPEEEAAPEDVRMGRAAEKKLALSILRGQRRDLVDALESDVYTIESVDRVQIDAKNDLVIFEITAGWGTEPYMKDSAWEVTRALLTVWDGMNESLHEYMPGLAVMVDSVEYECDGEVMIGLVEARIGRRGWERRCG